MAFGRAHTPWSERCGGRLLAGHRGLSNQENGEGEQAQDLAPSYLEHGGFLVHFGDELHPNGREAKIIAEAVFQVLPKE
jgi:hypothetical protein